MQIRRVQALRVFQTGLSVVICELLIGVVAPTANGVDVWITSGDRSSLLSQKVDARFAPGVGAGGTRIDVFGGQTFQTMEGFGAAMTDSSAWLFDNRLNPSQRHDLLKKLFSPQEGIGISYLRVPMGASDFAVGGHYSYNDLPAGQTDPNQTNFSITHDRQYIIPALLEARNFNPQLRLMASPWSAPGWMKTSGSMIGGSLAPQWSASYALYFEKFLQAYAAEGLPIDAISLQNEPLFVPGNYPGMFMGATQQADLIGNHFGPRFAASGIETKILAYDHNWDNTAYPLAVLNDPVANQYVAGSAFHGYGGNVDAQSDMHNAFPDKGIYFTEISGGDWATNFGDNLVYFAQNQFIGGTRNYAKNVLLWNLALDEHGEPHSGGCNGCRGVVTIDSVTNDVTLNEEFYSIAHASKFVLPGAIRISSGTQAGVLETVAFRNPDLSEVLLAVNATSQSRTMRVVRDGKHFVYNVPAKSLATFVWDGSDPGLVADFDNGGFEEGGYQATGGSLDAWQSWGNTSGNVAVNNALAGEGEHSLRLAGPGVVGSNAGVFQGMTVSPGDTVRASVLTLVRAAEPFAGSTSTVLLKLEYYSQFGAAHNSSAFLGETIAVLAGATTTTDVWEFHALQSVAPPNAIEARIALLFDQSSSTSAAVYLDSARLEVITAVGGDYNRDGQVDAADYVVWRKSLSQTGVGLAADGSGLTSGVPDGVVDQLDFEFWRSRYGETLGDLSPAHTPVPEPAIWTMFCIMLLEIFVADTRLWTQYRNECGGTVRRSQLCRQASAPVYK